MAGWLGSLDAIWTVEMRLRFLGKKFTVEVNLNFIKGL